MNFFSPGHLRFFFCKTTELIPRALGFPHVETENHCFGDDIL